MPGMGGLEALGHLMALPSPPAVIYVTGSDETGVAVAALKAGAVDYVVKTGSGDFFELCPARCIRRWARCACASRRAVRGIARNQRAIGALLHEMNHRVANSLQMVSSLVSLQTRRATGQEARAMLQDVRHRIQAISRIHRQLYTGESFQAVNMREYLGRNGARPDRNLFQRKRGPLDQGGGTGCHLARGHGGHAGRAGQ
jgi:DNA-binding LytR/AlgR family response regulator